jgi:hypothetical protein
MPPKLTAAHMQLAAQVPAHWLDSRESITKAAMATRKVVFRALLQPFLERTLSRDGVTSGSDDVASRQIEAGEGELELPEDLRGRTGTGETVTNRRLGKLPASAYADWSTFLRAASEKMGIDLGSAPNKVSKGIWNEHQGIQDDNARQRMANRLAVLHVLRCILGVAVESLIILDRQRWVNETLSKGRQPLVKRHEGWERTDEEEAGSVPTVARLVNLFDQGTGSGRNVAIVVTEWD